MGVGRLRNTTDLLSGSHVPEADDAGLVAIPEDRARYDYTVAKLYAKMGLSDQSLEYLRKAIEEGYKDLKNVYRDVEFSQLRLNPRFTELMALNMPVIPSSPR